MAAMRRGVQYAYSDVLMVRSWWAAAGDAVRKVSAAVGMR